MTEPLDAELFKDLRGLGKPPCFDGNDAEYQDFRTSFRIHMSLVSTVSQQLMDGCEVERNPISLAAVQALGDAHLKCCMQMCYSCRYAPDTQNRQYALMQKIIGHSGHVPLRNAIRTTGKQCLNVQTQTKLNNKLCSMSLDALGSTNTFTACTTQAKLCPCRDVLPSGRNHHRSPFFLFIQLRNI